MAITTEDRRNLAFSFTGFWKAGDHDTVWSQAHADFRRRFPASTLSLGEFRKLADMRGLEPVAAGGGGDRPHDVRLSVGSER